MWPSATQLTPVRRVAWLFVDGGVARDRDRCGLQLGRDRVGRVDGDGARRIEQLHRRGGPLVGEVTLAPVDEAVHAGTDGAGLVLANDLRVPVEDARVVEPAVVGVAPVVVASVR